MRAHQTDFSRGNVYRNILEVAIPLTLAQLLNLLPKFLISFYSTVLVVLILQI